MKTKVKINSRIKNGKENEGLVSGIRSTRRRERKRKRKKKRMYKKKDDISKYKNPIGRIVSHSPLLFTEFQLYFLNR